LPEPDVIQVSNVPISLAHAGVAYAVKRSIPVVVDIRDLWPDVYVDFVPDSLALLRAPLLNVLKSCSFQLKWLVRNASALTALTDDYLAWALDIASRSRGPLDSVIPMSHPMPSLQAHVSKDRLATRIGLNDRDVVATYVGNLGYQSDFDTLLASARQLAVEQPQLKIVIAGTGPRETELRGKVSDLQNVIFSGWLDGQDLAALLTRSQIGLVIYNPVQNYLKNIPNKYPEYLAYGLAIVCGLGGKMGQLTNDYGTGVTYQSGNVRQLTEALIHLTNASVRSRARDAARTLHLESFESRRIIKHHADHIELIANLRTAR